MLRLGVIGDDGSVEELTEDQVDVIMDALADLAGTGDMITDTLYERLWELRFPKLARMMRDSGVSKEAFLQAVIEEGR